MISNHNESQRQLALGCIERAIQLEPWLTYRGLGIPTGNGRWCLRTPKWYDTLQARIEAEQALLRQELDQVIASMEWLQLQTPIKTPNQRHTSYGYKHMVEDYFREVIGRHQYVANGAFIAAALGTGFKMQLWLQTAPMCSSICPNVRSSVPS